MLKLKLQDGREFPITEHIANALRDAKSVEKSTDMFTLTSPQTGSIVYEGEYRSIKEFVHPQVKQAEPSNAIEETRLLAMKKKREDWTDAFLKENDYDGSIMDSYLDMAAKKMEESLKKKWVGRKFISQLARVLIRQNNKCPYA